MQVQQAGDRRHVDTPPNLRLDVSQGHLELVHGGDHSGRGRRRVGRSARILKVEPVVDHQGEAGPLDADIIVLAFLEARCDRRRLRRGQVLGVAGVDVGVGQAGVPGRLPVEGAAGDGPGAAGHQRPLDDEAAPMPTLPLTGRRRVGQVETPRGSYRSTK